MAVVAVVAAADPSHAHTAVVSSGSGASSWSQRDRHGAAPGLNRRLVRWPAMGSCVQGEQVGQGEAERRAAYARLYAAFRAARRSLHGAAAAGAGEEHLQPLKEQLLSLRERLAAWQRRPA